MEIRPLTAGLPGSGAAPPSRWGFRRLRLRRGRRQLVFLPGGVLKVGRTPFERALLDAEVRGSQAAARHPFWAGAGVRALKLGRAQLFMRRFRSVTDDDFPAAADFTARRLEASLGYPRQPVLAGLERRPVFGRISPDGRDRLRRALAGTRLPATSMHGDFHLHNFVHGTGDGFRLIDWEHFDPDGSFAFDFLDFHLQAEGMRRGLDWPGLLAGLDPGAPVFLEAARVLGADPAALRLYYLALRIDINLTRAAAFPGTTAPTDLLPLLERPLPG